MGRERESLYFLKMRLSAKSQDCKMCVCVCVSVLVCACIPVFVYTFSPNRKLISRWHEKPSEDKGVCARSENIWRTKHRGECIFKQAHSDSYAP